MLAKNRFEKTVKENHVKTVKVKFWTLSLSRVFTCFIKKFALTLRAALINQ